MNARDIAGANFALSEAPPETGRHRFSHAAMATVFEVHCVHADSRYVAQAAQAAFDLVDGLERDLSRFVANSDVCRINLLAVGESTRVSPSTMECLTIARHLYDLTDTSFDVSLGSGLAELELEMEELTVLARRDGVRLDLGGIGKGYAVDRMAHLLEEWGIPHALVHGGYSSVLAIDAPPGQDGWPLTLSAPGSGLVLKRLSARFMALGASGLQKGGHILDPRNLRPVEDPSAAWVALAADRGRRRQGQHPAAVADALSTAFMILGVEHVAAFCRHCPGLEAWLLPKWEGEAEGPPLVHLAGPKT